MKQTPLKSLLIFFGVLIIIGVAFSAFSTGGEKPEPIDLGTLAKQMANGEIKSVTVSNDTLEITTNDKKTKVAAKEPGESFTAVMKNLGVSDEKLAAIDLKVKQQSGFAAWMGILVPIVLPIVAVLVIVLFLMRSVQGQNTRAMSFGQSGAREFGKNDKNRLTFNDVAGSAEAKEELMEVVDFLKSPKKFVAVGAKIPKGVLLMGPPGTGKTLMARAVAGEANVPFFHISGSEFVEMFVGVGAARVRDLFARAKKSAPCIIFIDEIDAVGRQRGAGLGGSHDEREQTLNQILVEMDGFDPSIGIIVMAATNRPDVLDPALLRPGRFDRRVTLDLPDIREREMILNIHAKSKPLEKDANMRRVAERTPGFSGADLANVMNEAAILTARNNRKTVSLNDILVSIEKVMLGPERKSRVITDLEKKTVAYHEAGHALVFHELPDADPVQKISIIARGHAGGYTLKMPTEDKRLHRKSSFIADLAGSLGGYAAEIEAFGEDNVTTGASSDLRNATALARQMVTDYGMSDLGPRTFGDKEEMIFLGRQIKEERDYSEKTAEAIDGEITRLVADARKTAQSVLKKKRDMLDKLVAALLEKETLEREAFEAIVGPRPQA